MRVFPKIGVVLVARRYSPLVKKIKTIKYRSYRQINLVINGAGKTDQPYMAPHV
jgi:hypothetical protein